MEKKETKKAIRIFALASFLNDLGSDIIYPIWPVFVTEILGANMSVLGFIDGLGEALVSISQGLSGYISDRIKKRKVFVWLGYLFGGLSRIGYALSRIWAAIIPFKILDRMGKIRSAPRDAIVADISTNENRGRNFGLLRAMDNLGAVCGIIICVLFFKLLGYRTLFLLAALPSIIGALLIFIFIKEKPAAAKIYKGLAFSKLDRNFKLFLFVSAIFSLGTFSYSFLLICAKEFGFKTITLPLLYLVFTAFAALFSLPFGKLSDKIGRKRVLLLSYILWGFALLSFIFTPLLRVVGGFTRGYLAVILSFVLYGLHKAAYEPVQRTFVAELAPSGFKASAIGGFQMVIGLCSLPASFFAGLLWDKVGVSAPFYFSLTLTALSIIALAFIKEV